MNQTIELLMNNVTIRKYHTDKPVSEEMAKPRENVDIFLRKMGFLKL